ncbi:hypothetical protein AB5N19_10845 [Seiridium cardinale]
MSSTPNAAPSRGWPNHSNNHNTGVLSAASKPTFSKSSMVPSKRSDDDVQFISSQPVKKQKLMQPKLQIKVTPPTASQSYHGIQQQQQSHAQLEPQISSVVVPSILLTPAPYTPSGNFEQEKTADLPQDRRVSTGMVGLPSDFHAVEAAFAMRGVSLPISASLENFVLNQPSGRPRPMSSPPLSPKQLPPSVPFSMLHASELPQNTVTQPLSQAPGESSLHGHRTITSPVSATSPSSAVVGNRPLTPRNSLSSVHIATAENPAPSTPPLTPSPAIQHYEQSPDKMKQTPTRTPLQQNQTPPPTINRPPGPKPHCQACVTQRALMGRAQGLPTSMLNMQKMPTHTMPQIPCPPMHSYPHSTPQFMAMQGFNPAFHPMMLPMHVGGFNGMVQPHSGMSFNQLPPTPAQQHSTSTAAVPQVPIPVQAGEMRQATSPTPPSPPPQRSVAPSSPIKSHPALLSTHRKPARNLIVDIAETCQEKFPFEEVAERQSVPVERVIEVFTAIIGVPLLRSANDRRRPGKVARNRVGEYQRAKKDIQEEKAETGHDAAGGNKDEIVVRPWEIVQRLGPAEMVEGP